MYTTRRDLYLKYLIFCFLFIPTLSWAQPKDGASLGYGFVYRQNFRLNNNLNHATGDYLETAIPMASIQYKGLSIRGPRIKYSFYKKMPYLQLAAHLRYYGNQYRAEGMYKRKRSFFGGFSARIFFFLDLIVLKDLEGRSDGTLFTLSLRKRFQLSDDYSMTFRLSSEFQDSNYVDYYFGVETGEANSTRPAYKADGTVNYALTWGHMYKRTPNLMFMVNINEILYGDEIDQSPTVRRDEQLVIFTALTYKF